MKYASYMHAGIQYRNISEYENTKKFYVKGLNCTTEEKDKDLQMEAFESIVHNYNKMNCDIVNGITPITES